MNEEHVKHAVDAGSAVTAIATLVGWLPSIAALFTIIWTAIRILESKSFEKFLAWLKK